MLHKTIEIIKSRWPEVTLVVVFQAGLTLLMEKIMHSIGPEASRLEQLPPEWAIFALGLGWMLMMIVWQMLYLGFLRTAAVDGPAQQEPMTLLTTGRGFFWRFLWMQILIATVLWAATGVLAVLGAYAMGYRDVQSIPQWILNAAEIGAVALLVKPFFLIPAFILAMDITAMDAFYRMQQVRLKDMGSLPKVYVIGLVIMAVAIITSALAPEKRTVYYMVAGFSFLVQGLITLILMLATTLFVADQMTQTQTTQDE